MRDAAGVTAARFAVVGGRGYAAVSIRLAALASVTVGEGDAVNAATGVGEDAGLIAAPDFRFGLDAPVPRPTDRTRHMRAAASLREQAIERFVVETVVFHLPLLVLEGPMRPGVA